VLQLVARQRTHVNYGTAAAAVARVAAAAAAPAAYVVVSIARAIRAARAANAGVRLVWLPGRCRCFGPRAPKRLPRRARARRGRLQGRFDFAHARGHATAWKRPRRSRGGGGSGRYGGGRFGCGVGSGSGCGVGSGSIPGLVRV
jgi:uncharacterized membrane protein YgcG